jgi:hypothetical protein
MQSRTGFFQSMRRSSIKSAKPVEVNDFVTLAIYSFDRLRVAEGNDIGPVDEGLHASRGCTSIWKPDRHGRASSASGKRIPGSSFRSKSLIYDRLRDNGAPN